ncbi:MAG: sigma-54-dependent Fis family transcriptional regulator [Planctomycetota bacterium]|nr:MAG: sigma-54-dependent Fis family transcriptional regulator [Planctomycetota bacterium]
MNHPPKILIADDEKAARFAMKKAFQKENYQLLEAENGKHVLEIVQNQPVDLVFLDINMPEMDGFEVLEKLQQIHSPPLVVMITAYGDEKIAVRAMKEGAYDYVRKPPELDELRLIAKNALEKIKLTKENQELKQKLLEKEGFGEIIGESEAMKNIFDKIQKVSKTDITVLITGENGTGKELITREIHRLSERKNGPFVAINCAALPDNLIESELFGHEKGAFTGANQLKKGKFELAHNGTIFLDEIGDMNLPLQAKLLRVLEQKQIERLGGNAPINVDVRVIAATNQNLAQMVQEGKFREDLYFRLKVVEIHIPPLRERREDIPLLAKKFIEMHAAKHNKKIKRIHPEVFRILAKYHWPGNVRQLKYNLLQSVLFCENEEFGPKDLPEEILHYQPSPPFKEFDVDYNLDFKEAKKQIVERFEIQFIEHKLKECKGNITQAAKKLNMHRQSLQHKLKELGINPNKFKLND